MMFEFELGIVNGVLPADIFLYGYFTGKSLIIQDYTEIRDRDDGE